MNKGFTLIEVLSISVILIILFLAALPSFFNQKGRSDLDSSANGIVSALELTRAKALAGEEESRWGVYFQNTSLPHYYAIFKGISYGLRDVNFDKKYNLPEGIEFSTLSFYGGGEEVVFLPVSGQTEQFGSLSLALLSSPSDSRTIYISLAGLISFSALPASDDGRLKDSRHVHLLYSGTIDVLTDKLILTFEGGVSQEIILADNMIAGQFSWQGEVEVLGETQELKIHTHYLNDISYQTIFCIHRDRRFNSRPLAVDLSSDTAPSPNLVYYNADDDTIKGNSLFVSEPLWQ